MTSFEELQQAMTVMGTVPPAKSKPDEYSGPDGVDGATIAPTDPIMDTSGVPTAPPITAAQRGKTLNTGQPPLPLPPQAAPVAGYPVNTPEAAPTSPGANSGGLKLVFTGVSGAGKSALVKQLGFIELRIDDPIQALYREFFPGQQAPADFVNTLLVWGEGAVDAKSPATPARLLFVNFLRGRPGFEEFGMRGFWQRELLARLNAASGPSVITTCTTNELLTELKNQGAVHFHVACSNQTLSTRQKRQGANDALATALTNQILREISMRPQGPMLPIVWSDTVAAPSPRFLTLETLRQTLTQNQQSVITGE